MCLRVVPPEEWEAGVFIQFPLAMIEGFQQSSLQPFQPVDMEGGPACWEMVKCQGAPTVFAKPPKGLLKTQIEACLSPA